MNADADAAWRRELRSIAVAALALLALMLASLGLSFVKLGGANLVAGLAIAAIKAAIVGWWFMRLRAEGAVVRIVAGVAAYLLLVLFTLAGIDGATRLDEPAPLQAPRQLEPVAGRAR